jgi:phosphopantothenoylcysteine decarboxylase/phosphopantothenate--cysteine ligase
MSKSKPFKPKKILIKMSGSIAAFKVCHVISQLTQAGHEVRVVTSPHASKFIGRATLEGLSQHPVISDSFAEGHAMAHIQLMRWADLIIAAPATANFINKIAHGVGDDLLTTLFLAHDFKKPYFVAPAMNTAMYLHPMTQNSLAKLKDNSIEILETESGVLACGEVGLGRLLEPELLLHKINSTILSKPKSNTIVRKYISHLLITSGGTQEPIDSMRVITNLSSGKTATRMAEYFYQLGFKVSLVLASNAVRPRFKEISVIPFQSYLDLETCLKKTLAENHFSAVIHAAAVSDFSVSELKQNNRVLKLSEDQKVKSDSDLQIHLKPNPKILPKIKRWSKNSRTTVIGFKFTSTQKTDERVQAVNKLFENEQVDLVVHNDSHDIDRKINKHFFTVFEKNLKTTACVSPLQLYQHLAFKFFEEDL